MSRKLSSQAVLICRPDLPAYLGSQASRHRPIYCEQSADSLAYDTNLYNLFAIKAKSIPFHTAISLNNESLSYAELVKLVNKKAKSFIELGIGCEDTVAICFHKSIPQVVSLLAALKIGAAFLLIHPDTPFVRICKMLKQSNVNTIITDSAFEIDFLKHLEQLGHELPLLMMINYYTEKNSLVALKQEINTWENHMVAQVVYACDDDQGLCELQFEHEAFISVINELLLRISLEVGQKILIITSAQQTRFLVELMLGLTQGLHCQLAGRELIGNYELLYQTVLRDQVQVLFAPEVVWHGLASIEDQPLKALAGICVREQWGVSSIIPILHKSLAQFMYYDDFISTVLCVGLYSKQQVSLASKPEEVANYLNKELVKMHKVSVFGVPRLNVEHKLFRSGYYLQEMNGQTYAFIKSSPRAIYHHGGKIVARDLEVVIEQYPGVESAQITSYDDNLLVARVKVDRCLYALQASVCIDFLQERVEWEDDEVYLLAQRLRHFVKTTFIPTVAIERIIFFNQVEVI